MRELIEDLVYSTVTSEDGSFLLWVDRAVGGATVSFDVSVEPPLAADAPQWTFPMVSGTGDDSTAIGELRLPRASYARGLVTDADGAPVAEAKLQVFQLEDADFCSGQCIPPLRLRGVFPADDQGVVPAVVLPDP